MRLANVSPADTMQDVYVPSRELRSIPGWRLVRRVCPFLTLNISKTTGEALWG